MRGPEEELRGDPEEGFRGDPEEELRVGSVEECPVSSCFYSGYIHSERRFNFQRKEEMTVDDSGYWRKTMIDSTCQRLTMIDNY